MTNKSLVAEGMLEHIKLHDCVQACYHSELGIQSAFLLEKIVQWILLYMFSFYTDEWLSLIVGFGPCWSSDTTMRGARQLPELLSLLDGVSLSTAQDRRVLTQCAKKDGVLDVGAVYMLKTSSGVLMPLFDFDWKNHAPSHVQLCVWILFQSLLQTRSPLSKRRSSLRKATCPIFWLLMRLQIT